MADPPNRVLRLNSIDMRHDMIEGSKRLKKAEIVLADGNIWDSEKISLFLNSLRTWTKEKRTPRGFKNENSAEISSVYYSFVNNDDFRKKIHINVNLKYRSFTVEASTAWLLENWDVTEKNIMSATGSQGRRNMQPKRMKYYVFS